MKKSLLIALAALTAVSAGAQLRTPKFDGMKLTAAMTQMIGQAQHKVAQQAQPGQAVVAKGKKIGANAAKYLRPQGTFYVCMDDAGYSWPMPYLLAKPYQDLTFTNVSTGSTTGNTWTYSIFNNETSSRDTLTTNEGTDFTQSFGYELEMTPRLNLTNGSSYTCTRGVRLNNQTGAIEAGPFDGSTAAVINFTDAADPNTEAGASFFLASPHYYGSSNRELTEKFGWTYYSGACGPDYDPELADNDPAQDRNGFWFGRNWNGDFGKTAWNGVALGVEKPAQPYILKHVVAWATAISGSGEFDLTCRVYRLDEMPVMPEDEQTQIDPAVLDDEHLIASGTYTITNQILRDGDAIMTFDLEEYDPELDMSYQVTPEIDFPILIVISGYEVEQCTGFSFLITNDEEDEGYGETTFQVSMQDDVIVNCVGLNNFFVNGTGMHSGPSIFMDIDLPFLIYNFVDETGEYTFPNEGGKYMFADQYDGVSLYGVVSDGVTATADQFTVTLEDGSDLPDWLTISLTDATGDYAGAVDAHVTCAPLPEGVQGREAKVRFGFHGAKIIYTFKQGEGGQQIMIGDTDGNGVVDITDVNNVINMMLGKAAMVPAADTDGNGVIDITDVNNVINLMLGK